jgi:RNA polymerase sigma-70 factor (family 1)
MQMNELSIINEENKLLHLIANGDEKAFGVVFKRYNDLLGSHIFRITNSHELAQEVVQDIFLKIWLNRTELIHIQNFKAYLYVLSKNHALNCLKRVAMERVIITNLSPKEDLQQDEVAEENEKYLLFDEAIDQLPPQQRKVYLMSRHERLRYAEIASRLNISTETVKKYLQIASESISSYVRKKHIVSVLSLMDFLF